MMNPDRLRAFSGKARSGGLFFGLLLAYEILPGFPRPKNKSTGAG
jgi:hypothetical protein